MKTPNIGLFGFGCVGQGLYDVLNHSLNDIGQIKKICVKNKDKKRPLPLDRFTFDKDEILNEPEIDTVVELIDDFEEAYRIVRTALENGKNVVTANKKMLAHHLPELQDLSVRKNVSFLYEASACGSIPIIRLLEEYYDNEPLQYIGGIFNGTTNYILTKTSLQGLSYEQALKEAQEKGFAESNPENDVEGWDALFKTVILSYHALGTVIDFRATPRLGITTLSPKETEFAKQRGYRIRLLAYAGAHSEKSYISFVLPVFVDAHSPLFDTNFEFNGVVTEGRFTSRQFLKGKGAGGHPTGSAVLSDLSALRYGYKYEFKKKKFSNWEESPNYLLHVYIRTGSGSDFADAYLTEKDEFIQDRQNKIYLGWITYENLKKLVPVLKKEKGFLALIGEPWNWEKKDNEKWFNLKRIKELQLI
ncbi:MAG: homoserine dehydrogenase [Bacteroidia bacterium]|nr:homoserine dehydrogenase [Bacteroidia bacterium]